MIMPQRTRDLPATCGPTPEEAARAMRSRNGFVFLESTLASAESISLLAWEPDLILETARPLAGSVLTEVSASAFTQS